MSVYECNLIEVLERIRAAYLVHNRETRSPVLKILQYTLCVMQCIIYILFNNETMCTCPLLDTMSLASLGRLCMYYMMQYLRMYRLFPSRLLEINPIFGIPRFMVVGLVASGFTVHEIHQIICSVVRELDLRGESLSPSWISHRLLEQVRSANR